MKRIPLLLIITFIFLSFFISIIFVGTSLGFLSPNNKKLRSYINPNPSSFKRGLMLTIDSDSTKNIKNRYREDNGFEWSGKWNDWGTIHRLYGGRLQETVKRTIRANVDNMEDRLIEESRGLIKLYPELFKITTNNLKLASIKRKAGIYYIKFDQYYQNIRVFGGGVQFRFTEDGELLLIGGDTYPEISINTNPIISKNEATKNILIDTSGLSDDDVELFILPWQKGKELGYILAWQISTINLAPKGAQLYFVDAVDGEILITKPLIRQAVGGKIDGQILLEYYNDTPTKVPFTNETLYFLDTTSPIYEETLDEDPGWVTSGLWEFGIPVPQDVNSVYSHAGCPDPSSGYTGSNVYGYNITGDYTNLMKATYLTTPAISCLVDENPPDCLVLAFWRWLGVYKGYEEDWYGLKTYYDVAEIRISDDDGYTWTGIWDNTTRQIEDGQYDSATSSWGGWKFQYFDISSVVDLNQEIMIQWGMGKTDDSGTFCGWNIDDIRFYESQKTQTDEDGEFLFDDSSATGTLVTRLEGKYAKVVNEDGASALYQLESLNPNNSATAALNINWDRDLSTLNSLDEFNAYYHINKMLAHLKSVEEAGGENFDEMDKRKPITVYVRYGDNYDNAFWSPDHLIAFGEGNSQENGFRNFVHFSDIIYHEYTHAITATFYSFLMPPLYTIFNQKNSNSNKNTTDDDSTEGPVFVTEFDAMHEAFSDYWACTINDDSMVGDGDFWVGHESVRNLDNSFKIPDDYGDDAYANSLILSGAMWETRQALGSAKADYLFHFARYGGASEFADFLIDVLMQARLNSDPTADSNFYFDQNQIDTITDIFGSRGISQAPSTPSGLIGVAGDTSINLKWNENPDVDSVVGYFVYFRTENDIVTDKEDPSVQRDAGNVTEYNLAGLTNGTTYVIKITAYNKYITESNDSDFVYATPYEQTDDDTSSNNNQTTICFIDLIK